MVDIEDDILFQLLLEGTRKASVMAFRSTDPFAGVYWATAVEAQRSMPKKLNASSKQNFEIEWIVFTGAISARKMVSNQARKKGKEKTGAAF